MDIAWYFNRLRVMDGRELLHRFRERAYLRALEKSQRRPAAATRDPNLDVYSFCTSLRPVLPHLKWDIAANEVNADALLEGHWPALGYPWQFSESANSWHRAPDTGAVWPAVYFERIKYRLGNPFGDARVVWEPSRLQQLVSLALLSARPKHRAQAVALLERQLASWVNANPPYRGIHYVSAMECSLRLIAVCHAVDFVRGFLTQRRTTWLCVMAIVSSHAQLILRRLSLHSSAGNHTIAEAAGLIYAGVLFPELGHAREWRDVGRTILHAEYQRQVLADGGGVEQSPTYLRFITDLAALSQRLLEPRVLHDPVSARIDLSCQFLEEISAPRGTLPAIGDSDGGEALSKFLRLRKSTVRTLPDRVLFPHSGYTILRSRGATAHQIVFDHGPLGMPPLHGHGHADALSVNLRRSGVDLLIDPGTYSYSDPAWRSYFRSTRAHNTVTVNGRDQAQQSTPFMWRHPFASRLVKYRGGEHALVLATHDGYRRIGVAHWRGLVYDHAGRLIVFDYVAGRTQHQVSLWWHLGVDATLCEDTVRDPSGAVALRISGATKLTRYRGSTDPIAGWQSCAYGVKSAATTIEANDEPRLAHEFCTVITMGNAGTLLMNAVEREHVVTLRRWIDAA